MLYLRRISFKAKSTPELSYHIPKLEDMGVGMAIRATCEYSGRNMQTDGVYDYHPFGVPNDTVTSCAVHDQVKPRPQD